MTYCFTDFGGSNCSLKVDIDMLQNPCTLVATLRPDATVSTVLVGGELLQLLDCNSINPGRQENVQECVKYVEQVRAYPKSQKGGKCSATLN